MDVRVEGDNVTEEGTRTTVCVTPPYKPIVARRARKGREWERSNCVTMVDGVVLKFRTLQDMRKHPWSAVFAEAPAPVVVGAKLPVTKAHCAVVYDLCGTERILLVDGAARVASGVDSDWQVVGLLLAEDGHQHVYPGPDDKYPLKDTDLFIAESILVPQGRQAVKTYAAKHVKRLVATAEFELHEVGGNMTKYSVTRLDNFMMNPTTPGCCMAMFHTHTNTYII
jgi:hypothetical protein